MKKIFAIFAGLSIILTACGATELADPTTREYQTYTGEFKSLGGIEVQDQITHLFETDDGDILYAFSDRYDLDDEAYFAKSVEAYGVVSVYENLDKPLFEVKRITDAPAVDETTTTVTAVPYQNADLGFSLTYSNDWTITEAATSVTLTAPLPTKVDENSAGDTTTTPELTTDPDYILVSLLETTLAKTSEDPQEDRATEIRDFVKANYAELAEIKGELSYVGTDRLLGVHYKTENFDSLYFVPRGDQLFELSYNHKSENDTDRLNNGNIFSSMVSGFRLTPVGESLPEVTVEDSTTDVVEDVTVEEPAPTAEQVSVKSYRELESKTFQFKMSYPGSWYYSGSSTGYDFNDKPIDETSTESILQMQFNASQTVGVVRSGTTVAITVKVGDRYYTVTGPAEYQTVLQAMADSIISTKES